MCKGQGNVTRRERGGKPSGQAPVFRDERPGVSEAGPILQQKESRKHKDVVGKKSLPLHLGLAPSLARGPVHGLLPALASRKQLA